MEQIRIGFYGKGGIGKSTISANVSAALSKMGKKVLHIGCDPKGDSSRSLMKRRIPTVLQRIEEKGDTLVLEDILFTGIYGVNCIEAGGPPPGAGCAGMGISAMMEEIDRLKIYDMKWDVIIYDVLGDVVCGGFSIPMRKKCVDQVYVVTSSEFMSLYAANNIMKGIAYYSSPDAPLFGGIIHNRASVNPQFCAVEKFVSMTESKKAAQIKQNHSFARLSGNRTVFEEGGMEETAEEFKTLGHYLIRNKETVQPKPLDDKEMDIFGETLYEKGINDEPKY